MKVSVWILHTWCETARARSPLRRSTRAQVVHMFDLHVKHCRKRSSRCTYCMHADVAQDQTADPAVFCDAARDTRGSFKPNRYNLSCGDRRCCHILSHQLCAGKRVSPFPNLTLHVTRTLLSKQCDAALHARLHVTKRVVITLSCHCFRRPYAVLGSHFHCCYIKNVTISSVTPTWQHCNAALHTLYKHDVCCTCIAEMTVFDCSYPRRSSGEKSCVAMDQQHQQNDDVT